MIIPVSHPAPSTPPFHTILNARFSLLLLFVALWGVESRHNGDAKAWRVRGSSWATAGVVDILATLLLSFSIHLLDALFSH